jgi:6-phosphofructokinase 1
MLKRIAVMTSGGDSPGMNAAIRAVVRVALHQGVEVWGIYSGYAGMYQDKMEKLTSRSVGSMMQRGGTFLGTARCEEFKTLEGRQQAAENLKRRGIEGVAIIGGDGSMRGAQLLSELGICVVGLPGTIDNDIWGTDYTIGFDTATNTVVDAINKLRDTASSHGRVIVLEVMGRNSGWIAMTAGLAGGAEKILIPEIQINYEDLFTTLHQSNTVGKKYSVVVVAEGAGKAQNIAEKIVKGTGLDTRVSVLGHIQRGGSPSVFDRILASTLGEHATMALISGMTNVMSGSKNGTAVMVDLADAIGNKRTIDASMFRLATLLAN